MVVFVCLGVLMSFSGPARGEASSLPTRLGSAFVVLVFGLGLIQGVNSVRVFLLIVTGIAVPATLVLLAAVKSVRELWIILGAALVSATGYFLLRLQREAKRSFASTAASLVVIGSLTGLSAPMWLPSVSRATFSKQLVEASATTGDYVHTGSGLSVSPPGDWVRLRTEASLVAGSKAEAAFANPKSRTVTFLHVVEGDFVAGALDAHIDRVLEARREREKDLTEEKRVDATIAGARARRSETVWTEEGEAFSGFVATFAQRDRLFILTTVTYGPSTPEASAEYRALEAAFHLPGERKVDVEAAVRTVGSACPALSPNIIRRLALEMLEGAPPALWFSRAWAGALRGQRLLAPDRVEQLRIVMQEAFSGMKEADRRRFSDYCERIREGLPTTNEEDEKASLTLSAAYRQLSPTSQARLHELTELAYALGSES